MTKENKPEMRFSGFNEDWKQRKFGDFAKVSMCKRVFKEETTQTGDVPFFKIGTFGGIPDAFISRYKFESYKAKYPYPKKGDILISASGSIGRIVEYSGKDEYFQDSNIIWLDHDESVLNSFLKHVYSIIKWNGIEGTTIKRLYNDNVLTTKILTPSLEEQSKIGIFFTQLDNTITLQQRKLELLKNQKKAFLEKMFPKEGENVPEIRFSGFSDAWKQRKFGEFVERKSDSALSSTSIPSVEYENVESETGILKKDIYVKTEFKKGVLFSDKDVLYGKLRPYLHNWLAPSFTGVAVGDWWVLSPKNCSKDFLYRLLQTLTFDEIANQTSGTKMPRADWNLVSSTAFYIPSSIEEQAKIGSLFNRIDSTITLQQRKLEILKNIKKSFLQKMFV